MVLSTIPYEETLIVSSDPKNGAVNITDKGSRFDVNLSGEGIYIPKKAIATNISVEEATVWWVIPNIETGENDKLYVNGPNTLDVLTNYTLTVPQGLYDLDGLNQSILRLLENAGAKTNPEPLITLLADENTQKVVIRFNYNNVSVDFTQNNTFRNILGFNSQILGPYAVVPINQIANNTANFNTVNSFLLHSSLVSQGIRINDTFSSVISNILIDVAPGSQIISKPFNPAKIASPELNDTRKTTLQFWLTDDENRVVNTNGEYFTARIVIRYLLPYVLNPELL